MKIKKITSICSLLMCMVMFAGCSIETGRNSDRVKDDFNFDLSFSVDDADYTDEFNQSFAADDIQEINITAAGSELNIKETKDSEIKVVRKSQKNSPEFNAEIRGNTFIIKEDLTNNKFSHKSTSKIDIEIPETLAAKFNISIAAGECSIKNINALDFDFSSGAGDNTIENLSCENFTLEAGAASSEIELTKSKNIKLSTGAGETVIKIDNPDGDFTCEGGVGTTEIKIPENSPVYFDAVSGIGEVNLNAKVSGEKKFKYEIENGIGEIDVNNI